MKTLQLQDGDLVIGPNGYQTVDGVGMVTQDLRCALGEPLGNDRFHPGYGSALEDYIGAVLDEMGRFTVEQEVNRVVGNYTAIQSDRMQRDALMAAKSRFSAADIIASVSGVTVTSAQDTVQVAISLTTLSGDTANVDMNVSP